MSAALAFCHFVNAPGLIGVAGGGGYVRLDYSIGVYTDSCDLLPLLNPRAGEVHASHDRRGRP